MKQAHDWAIDKYESWGIEAFNHEWGKWRGWERGITHVDLIEPRLRTLVGRQLAGVPPLAKRVLKQKLLEYQLLKIKSNLASG